MQFVKDRPVAQMMKDLAVQLRLLLETQHWSSRTLRPLTALQPKVSLRRQAV